MATCPDCKVEMIAGRRRDRQNGDWTVMQEAWLYGDPNKGPGSFFPGLEEHIEVTTYACPQCGLLRSYIKPYELPPAPRDDEGGNQSGGIAQF